MCVCVCVSLSLPLCACVCVCARVFVGRYRKAPVSPVPPDNVIQPNMTYNINK